MLDNEDGRNTLYIPANITTRVEPIKGIGLKDLGITAVVGVITLIIVSLFSNLMIGIPSVVLVFFVCFGLLKKDPNMNRSILDWLHQYFKFSRSQQKFKYVFTSKYEIVRGEED